MTTFDLPSDYADTDTPETVDNDGKRECPDCGRRFTVTQAGTIRAHKCGDTGSTNRNTGKRKSKRTRDVPPNVLRVSTAGIASGTEWVASRVVAQYVPCHPSQVPAELPDADTMVGPLVKLAWPQLPAKAQSLVASICDQEDLILCALDWFAWARKLQAFAIQAHKIVAEHKEQETHASETRISIVNNEGADKAAREVGANGVQGQTTEIFGRIRAEQFKPAG